MASEAPTLPLLRGTTTLESALEQEENMLMALSYPEKRINFFVQLLRQRKEIELLVAYHLGLISERCRLADVREWIHGSFNLCIPVYIDNWQNQTARRVMIRFALPYKCGEDKSPGNVDEKLRCEAATYIWIRDNCPDVPIPKLWGFGFVGGQSFTRPENSPLITRFIWQIRRLINSLFRASLPCHYIIRNRGCLMGQGYLVMDYIEDTGVVQMLSETWDVVQDIDEKRAVEKRHNLLKDLSRIMLSLSQLPMPSIGSWTIDFKGYLRLSNRPLTLRLHQLENEGIPTNIDRNRTYSAADGYYLDILLCHDSRIQYQPNSVIDEDDARAQMANLTIMRAALPTFTNRELRHGPFVFRLTDLHQSNIFVDENWHIKCVIDLEWACSLPIETLRPPYWLTGCHADNIVGEKLDKFSQAHTEFLQIFEDEEKKFPTRNGRVSYRTEIMRRGWKIGNFWYFQALDSPKALYNIFRDHIQPKFAPSPQDQPAFDRVVSNYWATDVTEVVDAKLREKAAYETSLTRLLEAAISEMPAKDAA